MPEESVGIPGHPRISKTPRVCGGDACVRTTRIMVWLLAAMRRNGASEEYILESYPQLDPEDLEAAWQYMAEFAEEIDQALRYNGAF